MATRKTTKPTAKPKGPTPKFMMLGKSKFVHVVRTKAYDLKHSECQQVRKLQVADKIPSGKGKGLTAEAASALEPCQHCHTDEVIGALVTPEAKREQAKEKQSDFMHRMREENRPKTGKGSKKKRSSLPGKDHPKSEKREGRSGGGSARLRGDSTKEKADGLVAFAVEHGWEAEANTVSGEPGVLVEANRGDEYIRCWFVDGKYDAVRHATVNVGDWSGKLRGVHGCRKQMANEGRDRPHPEPGKGRAKPVGGKRSKRAEQPEDVPAEDESPEDARRRVPFLLDEDEAAIIDAVKGKTIRWRNGLSNTMDEATLPSKHEGKKRSIIDLADHPKTGRRILTFLEVVGIDEGREVYGPERSVALDKIVRVVG